MTGPAPCYALVVSTRLLIAAFVAGAAVLSAQGKVTGTAAPGSAQAAAMVVPAGTEVDIKVSAALGSGTVQNDQRFEGATLVDVKIGTDVAVPAGSIVRGFVSSFKSISPANRRGSLTLAFDELRIGERASRLRATVVDAFDPKMSEDLTRIGPGVAANGTNGGILGSGKASLAGVIVGIGVILSAGPGDVKLPAGAVLRIRIDAPVQLNR